MFQKDELSLQYEVSAHMCADIFTKGFTEVDKWKLVCKLICIIDPAELRELQQHIGDIANASGEDTTSSGGKGKTLGNAEGVNTFSAPGGNNEGSGGAGTTKTPRTGNAPLQSGGTGAKTKQKACLSMLERWAQEGAPDASDMQGNVFPKEMPLGSNFKIK